MPRSFVDLSIYLENGSMSDLPGSGPKIDYFTHDTTQEQLASFFPGLHKDDLPDGEGWAYELVRLSTRSGTHMAARGIAIPDVPLAWCYQPAVKLDFAGLADGHVVTAADVERELKRIGHVIRPLDIVVVNTSAGARYGSTGYVDAGCRVGGEATRLLFEAGVRVMGTDAWRWSAPGTGQVTGCCQLEKLHNLETLPPDGFHVACFPHKIRGASAGWTRAVAIIP
ncbi:MAG: cyclase family protein [Ramlibacter sp.]|nr:cyclase family protein [Ramlibacter sp.]